MLLGVSRNTFLPCLYHLWGTFLLKCFTKTLISFYDFN
ncbi:hypothetical protein BACOVA_03910 [Bacteroides ovatus ATCC 8483]|uniref:Uncharacterized protein n=1 Tax=Bacteroides ovatus (strain ATCC 8483 / DSM 1896 / JCM 5824 / BCRC 10623 / CCUG 4943 / NCTC 11153) TaxID=411476 RepID=A0AAN3A617_BACO1|nr:hypothetical protein BACOVA_03910 [Bacteroides ovatus ATCC 8483]